MRADDEGLDAILERIRAARNLDFRHYRRALVRRRIARRMSARGCEDPRRYLQLLERSPREHDALVSALLGKAPSFFRDPEAWEALATKALPGVVAGGRSRDEIRAWSVGSATGEETYSAAMLLLELLGPSRSRRRVRIFGTDVDEVALAFARRGVYARPRLAGLSGERVARFFTPAGDGYAVRKELRRCVVFGVNDVVDDAPISHVDLILCRSVLGHLDAEPRKRVLSRFHGALRPGGVLFLGRSGVVPFATKLFEPVDPERRIYRRGAAPAPDDTAAEERRRASGRRAPRAEPRATTEQLETTREELRSTREELAATNEQLLSTCAELEATNREVARRVGELDLLRLRERAVLASVSAAVVVIDERARIVAWNLAAERVLGLAEAEARGRVLWTLRLPILGGELAQRVRRALSSGLAFRAEDVAHERPGVGRGHAMVAAVPLVEGDRPRGAVVVLEDTTRAVLLAQERLRTLARRERRGGDGGDGAA